MAIAIHADRRHVIHRPPWVRRRADDSNAALSLIMVLLLTVGVTALLLSSQLLDIRLPRGLVPTMQPAAPARPTQGATPVAKTSVAATTEQPALSPAVAPPVVESAPPPPGAENPQADSEPQVLAVGGRARVANTENLGLVFYAAPRDGARLPAGLLEGTAVTVLELSGGEWARVQSDAKKTGWVRAAYLASSD